MSFPDGLPTTLVTYLASNPAGGGPAVGTVEFAPTVPAISVPDFGQVYSGRGTYSFNSSGQLVDALGGVGVRLLPNDVDGANPETWYWMVTVRITKAPVHTFYIKVSVTQPEVDLYAIEQVDPDKATYVLVNGPEGPQGPAGADGSNADAEAYTDAALADEVVRADAAYDPAGAASAAQSAAISAAAVDATTKASAAQAAAVSAAASDATAKVAAHEADTTAVHGIADTSVLETQSGAQAKATAAQTAATSAAATDATNKVAAHTGASDPHGDRANAATLYLPKTTFRRRDFPYLNPGVYSGSFTPTLTATSTQPASTIGWRPPLVTMAGTGDTAEQRGPFAYGGTLATDLVLSDTITPGFNYVLSTGLQPHTVANPQSAWSTKFRTSAQVVHIRFRYMAATNAIQVIVNGQRLWATPQLISGMSGVGTAGNSHILAIDFGSVAARDIQVELTCPFWGIYTATAYPLSGFQHTGPHLCGYGDSITGGASPVNTGGPIGTWLYRLGHRLGCSRITNASRGGTGFTATNSPYTALTDPARYQDDVIAKSPDIVLVWAGYNDDGTAGSQTAWQAAVDTVLVALKAGLPNALIILVGCWSPTGPWGTYTTPTTLVSKDTWGRARATANSVPFISPITGDVLSAAGATLGNLGPWITGQGHVSATTGYGNADWSVGSSADTVHPTDLGAEHVEKMMWDSMQLLLSA